MQHLLNWSPDWLNVTAKLTRQKWCDLADKDCEFSGKEYLVNWIVDNLPAATKYARRPMGQDVDVGLESLFLLLKVQQNSPVQDHFEIFIPI